MAGFTDLYVRADFLSTDRALDIAASLSAGPGEPASVQAAPGAELAVHDEVRRAWEVEISDAIHDDLVARIQAEHHALESFFSTPLQVCDAVAAMRYPPGAFYRTHRDVAARPDPNGMHRRAVSLVLFVNSGLPVPGGAFAGGALRLHGIDGTPHGWRDVVPTAGTLVAFRSAVLHEVRPVVTGTRLSIVTWLLHR